VRGLWTSICEKLLRSKSDWTVIGLEKRTETLVETTREPAIGVELLRTTSTNRRKSPRHYNKKGRIGTMRGDDDVGAGAIHSSTIVDGTRCGVARGQLNYKSKRFYSGGTSTGSNLENKTIVAKPGVGVPMVIRKHCGIRQTQVSRPNPPDIRATPINYDGLAM